MVHTVYLFTHCFYNNMERKECLVLCIVSTTSPGCPSKEEQTILSYFVHFGASHAGHT